MIRLTYHGRKLSKKGFKILMVTQTPKLLQVCFLYESCEHNRELPRWVVYLQDPRRSDPGESERRLQGCLA